MRKDKTDRKIEPRKDRTDKIGKAENKPKKEKPKDECCYILHSKLKCIINQSMIKPVWKS